MGSVTVQKRPTLRALHHASERKEMQVQPISKDRLHTVEFVEQLELAIQHIDYEVNDNRLKYEIKH